MSTQNILSKMNKLNAQKIESIYKQLQKLAAKLLGKEVAAKLFALLDATCDEGVKIDYCDELIQLIRQFYTSHKDCNELQELESELLTAISFYELEAIYN